MAELATLARPYAHAGYEYAAEHKVVAEWLAMLKGLTMIANDKRVQRYLSNPELTAKQAAEVFFDIGKELLQQTKTAGKNFLMIMAENKRLLLIPHVYQLFEKFYAQDESLLHANVYAAQLLSQSYKNKLKESLSARFKKDVQLSCHTDETLIAGAIIQVGDFVIDGSVLGKLQRLKNQIV
jgi:F-type H+-transporting ATPase subunit delta